jgi:hypothetical protein
MFERDSASREIGFPEISPWIVFGEIFQPERETFHCKHGGFGQSVAEEQVAKTTQDATERLIFHQHGPPCCNGNALEGISSILNGLE